MRDRREVLLLWVPFVIGAALMFRSSVDDSFIVLRYARNLVHGHGLVFNPGERVEGFSSPLHLALVAVVQGLPGGALCKVKLLSLAFGAATVWRARRLVEAVELPVPLHRLGLALVGGSFPLAVAAGNGLETSLVAFLVVALLVELVTDAPGIAAPGWWRAGLVGGLLALARPEGIALVAALAIVTAGAPVGRGQRSRWLLVAVGAWVALVVARLAYYGQLLPNTYFAKHPPLGPALRHGTGYVAVWLVPGSRRGSLSPGHLLMDVVLAGLVALIALGTWAWRRHPRLRALPTVIVVQAALVVVAGGDWMLGSRYLAPVAIPTTLTALHGVATVGRRPASGLRRLLPGAAVAAVAVASIGPWLAADLRPAWSGSGRFDDRSLLADSPNPRWATLPDLIRCAPPGWTVATSEVGFSSWVRPDLRFLDLRGLTDERIAHGAPRRDHWITGLDDPDPADDQAFIVRELLRRRPELLETFYELDPQGALARHYRRIGELGGHTLYLRRDLRPCSHPT